MNCGYSSTQTQFCTCKLVFNKLLSFFYWSSNNTMFLLHLLGFLIDTFHCLTCAGKSDCHILTGWPPWEFRAWTTGFYSSHHGWFYSMLFNLEWTPISSFHQFNAVHTFPKTLARFMTTCFACSPVILWLFFHAFTFLSSVAQASSNKRALAVTKIDNLRW